MILLSCSCSLCFCFRSLVCFLALFLVPFLALFICSLAILVHSVTFFVLRSLTYSLCNSLTLLLSFYCSLSHFLSCSISCSLSRSHRYFLFHSCYLSLFALTRSFLFTPILSLSFCVCTLSMYVYVCTAKSTRADVVCECICLLDRAGGRGMLWVRGRGRHGYEVRCAGGGIGAGFPSVSFRGPVSPESYLSHKKRYYGCIVCMILLL